MTRPAHRLPAPMAQLAPPAPGRSTGTSGRLEIASLGTLLGIWAHPDDETLLTAGLMAACRDSGQRVVCVSATRGERGNRGLRQVATRAARKAPNPRITRRAGRHRRQRSPCPWLPGRNLRPAANGPGGPLAGRCHRTGLPGHHRDLRSGRNDRARGPPGHLALGDRRTRPGRPAGPAPVCDHQRGIRRPVAPPQRQPGGVSRRRHAVAHPSRNR